VSRSAGLGKHPLVRLALALAVALVVALPASAHLPGTDGGPAQRGCAPVIDARYYVGATKVSCRVARKVARGVIQGRAFSRWGCTFARPGRGFGHCHGHGPRRGAIVHWAVND
jgi:hypothetical protein